MARAYGSSAHLLMKRETTYGQAATGNYLRMPFNRCNLGSEQGLRRQRGVDAGHGVDVVVAGGIDGRRAVQAGDGRHRDAGHAARPGHGVDGVGARVTQVGADANVGFHLFGGVGGRTFAAAALATRAAAALARCRRGVGAGVHFTANEALAVAERAEGGSLLTLHVRVVLAATPLTVKADTTMPGRNVSGWPRTGPPGSTLFCGPIGTVTVTTLGL